MEGATSCVQEPQTNILTNVIRASPCVFAPAMLHTIIKHSLTTVQSTDSTILKR